MCGRIALINPDEEKIKKHFKLKSAPRLKPRFNIPPSSQIPVIKNDYPEEVSLLRWGLIPHWAKDEKIGYKMINARAETIHEKPSFRGPIRHKRCLILVDTFYEWRRTKESKKPYRFMMKNEEPFVLAGIWDEWDKNDHIIQSCSIITTKPNELMKPIHDRMPVIIPQEKAGDWLNSKLELKSVLDMLCSYPEDQMSAYEVSTLVNSPANDQPEVLTAV